MNTANIVTDQPLRRQIGGGRAVPPPNGQQHESNV